MLDLYLPTIFLLCKSHSETSVISLLKLTCTNCCVIIQNVVHEQVINSLRCSFSYKNKRKCIHSIVLISFFENQLKILCLGGIPEVIYITMFLFFLHTRLLVINYSALHKKDIFPLILINYTRQKINLFPSTTKRRTN